APPLPGSPPTPGAPPLLGAPPLPGKPPLALTPPLASTPPLPGTPPLATPPPVPPGGCVAGSQPAKASDSETRAKAVAESSRVLMRPARHPVGEKNLGRRPRSAGAGLGPHQS